MEQQSQIAYHITGLALSFFAAFSMNENRGSYPSIHPSSSISKHGGSGTHIIIPMSLSKRERKSNVYRAVVGWFRATRWVFLIFIIFFCRHRLLLF